MIVLLGFLLVLLGYLGGRWHAFHLQTLKELPASKPEKSLSPPKDKDLGPYRTIADDSIENIHKLDNHDLRLEPYEGKDDIDGSLTITGAKKRYQKIKKERLNDIPALFREKVQPRIEEAIDNLEKCVYIFNLPSVEKRALAKYIKYRLGFSKVKIGSDYIRIDLDF